MDRVLDKQLLVRGPSVVAVDGLEKDPVQAIDDDDEAG